MGVRWEMHPSPNPANDYMVTFDVKNNAIATPRPLDYYVQNGLTTPAIITNLQNLGAKFETFQQGGLPSNGISGSNANVLPRFGFAWTPPFARHGTVIRGGYGEYIYPVPIRNSIRYLTASYPFTAGYSQSYTAANYSPDGLPNLLLRDHPSRRGPEQQGRGQYQLDHGSSARHQHGNHDEHEVSARSRTGSKLHH